MRRMTSEPAPWDHIIGTRPRNITATVITFGRKRLTAPSSMAIRRSSIFRIWPARLRAVLLLFNLLTEFQRAAGLPLYREPATLRTQVLTCGAILGRAGRRLVFHLSESWGGLKTRIPLLDSILNWQIPTSPKLEPVLQT